MNTTLKHLLLCLMLALAAGTGAAQLTQYDDAYYRSSTIDSLMPVVGEWKYKGPIAEMKGKNVLSSLGKPISKGKVKKELKNAFKKTGIAHKKTRLRLRTDGTFGISFKGSPEITGTYTYSPRTGVLRLKWHSITLPLTLATKGKNLALSIDTSRMLTAVEWLATLTHNEGIAALAFLARNYSHVAVGLELKR